MKCNFLRENHLKAKRYHLFLMCVFAVHTGAEILWTLLRANFLSFYGPIPQDYYQYSVFSPGRGLAGFPQEKTEMAH